MVALIIVFGVSAAVAESTGSTTSAKEPLVIPVLPAPSTEPGFVAAPANTPTLHCEVTRGMPLPLAAVAFSPDGKTLAVGGLGEVVLWDLAEGRLASRIEMGQPSTMVQAVVFTNDGSSLAAGQGSPYVSGTVSLVDVETGQSIAEFKEPKGLVNCLTLSPDRKLLVAGCGDGAAYVWSLDDKKLIATLKDHNLPVLSAAFSTDGKFLATGGADAMVQAWDTETWEPDIRRTTVGGEVRRCMIVRSSKSRQGGTLQTFGLLIGGREDRTLRVILDSKAQAWQRTKSEYHAPVEPGVPLDCVWLAGRDKKAFVACSDGTIKVFAESPPQITHTATLRGHSDWVYGLALNADASRFASASGDGTVKIWNTADNQLLATLIQLTPKTDQWLIVTAEGWYAASNPEAVNWNAANLEIAPNKLAALQNLEAVQQTLAGEPPTAPSLP
jgi:WD40 repeat protein